MDASSLPMDEDNGMQSSAAGSSHSSTTKPLTSMFVESDQWAGMYEGELVGNKPHGFGILKMGSHRDNLYKGNEDKLSVSLIANMCLGICPQVNSPMACAMAMAFTNQRAARFTRDNGFVTKSIEKVLTRIMCAVI